MVQAESSPSESDGEVAAGAEAESARIVELLKEKRGGESLPFGDGQLAAVAEEMVRDSLSAAMLRERTLAVANMVDAVSPYFAAAMGRDRLPPVQQAILRAWWLGAAQAAGGTLQVARSAGAPAGRAAPDLAAEKPDLTGAQVAELAKQNLNSSGALALSVSLLTGYVVTSMDLESGGPAFEGAVYGRNLWTVKCVRQTKDDPGSLHHAIRSGERSQVVQHLRNLGKDYREREMLAEASLILEFSAGLAEITEDRQFFTYLQRFFRKYPGRGLPELPLDRSLRDDVYREHERGTESFKKELAELTKRVTKAEEASAEAQRAAAEAKRASKPAVKTCFWCGGEGHVKPDCPVFLAGEPKVKKGN